MKPPVLFCLLLFAWMFASPIHAAPFVPTRSAQSVAFSRDGRLAVTGKSGMSDSEFPPRPHPSPRKTGVLHIWDVETGKFLKRIETFGDITKVEFSADAKLVAASRLYTTTDGIDLNEVRVWEVASGKTVHAWDRCHAFDFSPDGTSIAVASRVHGVIYDLKDGRKLEKIRPLGGSFSVQYSADASALIGVRQDEQGAYHIRIVSLLSGTITDSPGLKREFYRVALSPSGKTMATGHPEGQVLLWNLKSLQIIGQLKMDRNRGLQHPFFSPSGRYLGSGSQENGDVVFWDLNTGKELRRFTFQRGRLRTYRPPPAQDEPRAERDPQRFVFSPDGSSFLAGCHGGMIRLLSTGQDIRHFTD